MKKSELKEQIANLEYENRRLKKNLLIQEDITSRIVDSLKNEFNIIIDIKQPEPPKIDVTTSDDIINGLGQKFVYGITTDLPIITIDFSRHDLEVIKNNAEGQP